MTAITKEEIISIAIAELSLMTLGYTEQFLEIHQVAIRDGIPDIEHVRILEDGIAVVYFKVHDEEFFFAVSVDMEKKEPRWSYSEVYTQVSFVAESTELNYDALNTFTKLKPDWGWNKDPQAIQRGKRVTKIGFQPYKEPDSLENKLRNLLDYLDTDKDGIRNLITRSTGAYIITTTDVHNSNSHIGGIHLEPHIINRLADMNISIDFDFYAVGNLLKEPDWETYFDDDDNDSKEEG